MSLDEKLEASPDETVDVERREQFEQFWNAYEELSEEEEETINVINDMADTNYDDEDEQHQLAELISGTASQLGDNEVANAFFDLMDEHVEQIRDELQDEFEVDFDTVGESKLEADISELIPGKTVVFTDGEYKGLTGTIQKTGVGSDRNMISVQIHQRQHEDKIVYVEPRYVSKPNFQNVSDNDQEPPAEEV